MRKLLILIGLCLTVVLSGQRLPGVVAASGQVTAAASSLITGLVSYWDLDDGVTGTADDGKDSNDGTVTGATQNQAEAKIGKSVLFDAALEKIDCGNPANLQLSTEGTISAWIYTITISGASAAIISDENYSSDRNGISIMRYTNDIYIYLASGAAMQSFTHDNEITINTWYHIVVSFKTTGDAKCYINAGTPETSAMTLTPVFSVNNWNIGNTPAVDAPWTGYIDLLRIWNRQLTDAEVTELYTKENAGTTYPWN